MWHLFQSQRIQWYCHAELTAIATIEAAFRSHSCPTRERPDNCEIVEKDEKGLWERRSMVFHFTALARRRIVWQGTRKKRNAPPAEKLWLQLVQQRYGKSVLVSFSWAAYVCLLMKSPARPLHIPPLNVFSFLSMGQGVFHKRYMLFGDSKWFIHFMCEH